MAIVRFAVLGVIKLLSAMLFRFDAAWIGERPVEWQRVKLAAVLNHTSLFEPIFVATLPWVFIWRTARRGAFPGADKTLDRPIVGSLFKLMAPHVISITRKRDGTWTKFLEKTEGNTMVLIAPEGRMKRPDGMDKDGKPMTVRGGIVDLLNMFETGQMVLAYSGGLHHVQSPGERRVRLFQRVKIAYECVDIQEYRKSFPTDNDADFRKAVIADLEKRRDTYCPSTP